MMTRIVALLILTSSLSTALLSSSSGERRDRLEALPAKGQIQESASVKAASEIVIKASSEKVWQILTGVNEWPKWQSTVTAAHINGAREPGITFSWVNGGTEIKSRIALVRRYEQVGWTGTAHKARAIHIWTLQHLPYGSTLVKTTESMDGFLLTGFYSSEELAKSHDIWLQALKHRAEE